MTNIKEEFDLSKKEYRECPVSYFLKSDVKEFIRLLKGEFPINCKEHHKFHNKIDKLAGEKLCQ